MEVGPLELPEPHPFEIEGLNETFHVYEGTIQGALPVVLTKDLGDVALKLRVSYQACGEYFCNPPTELALELPLSGQDLVRD
jgi:hypothetical protein